MERTATCTNESRIITLQRAGSGQDLACCSVLFYARTRQSAQKCHRWRFSLIGAPRHEGNTAGKNHRRRWRCSVGRLRAEGAFSPSLQQPLQQVHNRVYNRTCGGRPIENSIENLLKRPLKTLQKCIWREIDCMYLILETPTGAPELIDGFWMVELCKIGASCR